MIPKDYAAVRERFAAELAAREVGLESQRVTAGLCLGLTTLRDLLFARVHEDVEKHIGRDSIMIPLSALESEEKAKVEIELFQVAVATAEAKRRQYVADATWFEDWLCRFRLGDSATDSANRRRLTRYLELSSEDRRLGFSRVLEKAFPEATRAPLILYQLFPLAIAIVTATAFGDVAAARDLRERQSAWLPSIGDCRECRGRVLDNGVTCPVCSNPVWKYAWLNATI